MGVSYESLGTDILWKKKLLFSSIFIEATKLQTAFDRFNSEVSSKQWLLLVIASSFSEPPTLTEVGELMGCSRQNVKKIAVILEKKGYLTLTNIKDKRSTSIELASKFKILAAEMEADTTAVMDLLFGEFSDEQINEFFSSMLKLSKGIEALDKHYQKKI